MLTVPCNGCTISFRCRRSRNPRGVPVLIPTICSTFAMQLAAGRQLPHHQAVDLQEKGFAALQTPADTTASREPKSTSCSSALAAAPSKKDHRSSARQRAQSDSLAAIDSVRISGLMAEVKISIGAQQITSIITANSAREMQLEGRPDRRRPHQSDRGHDSPGLMGIA